MGLEGSSPEFGGLVSDIGANGCKQILIQGGDPFLNRPALYEIVRTAAKQGIGVSIQAPGVNLVSDDIQLITQNGVRLIIPIFGFDRYTHESITKVKGSFEAIRGVVDEFGKNLLPYLSFRPRQRTWKGEQKRSGSHHLLVVPLPSVRHKVQLFS